MILLSDEAFSGNDPQIFVKIQLPLSPGKWQVMGVGDPQDGKRIALIPSQKNKG